MGEIATLPVRFRSINQVARRRAWKSLTLLEQAAVKRVETEDGLFGIFDAAYKEYLKSRRFLLPPGLSENQEKAIRIMRRFVDEISTRTEEMLAERFARAEARDYGIHGMPAH